jgi:hypothetical protein
VTSQEEVMLNSLVERVNATQLSEKDPEAAALLARGLSGNPDALYILAQSVLVQNIALEQAHAQLAQAKQPAKTSFLGSLLGHRDPAPQPPPPQPPQQGYQQVYSPPAPPEYYPPPPPYQGVPQGGPYYGAPPMGGPMGGGFGGQPSFLRSAAQTAAGVAAGALAFEGVEALLHGGFGHPGMGMGMGGWGMPGVGFGMGMGGMGFERPIEENVVNNYYDSPGGQEHEHGGEQHFHESVGDGGGQLSDASWSEDSGGSSDSGGSFDDGGSGFDDSGSSFGDGGSGGDNGGF